MKFSWIDTGNHFLPKLTPSERYAETAAEYCSRMATFLPNFPAEVITQWFYEHWGQIDEYAWLDYSTLKFTKEDWNSEKIMDSGIQKNRAVQIDHQHFEDHITHEGIERISRHFQSRGTWPVPPVFLENLAKNIKRPDGWVLTSPFYLLEGHHRCGLFWSFFGQNALRKTHYVWVARINHI